MYIVKKKSDKKIHEIIGEDQNGNIWKISMRVTNPRYSNRFEMFFSINDIEYAVRKYNTVAGANEAWLFLSKFYNKSDDTESEE